ncbi:MAG: NAD-dependent epimerase/dehydratase family protein [Ignavibacteriales bacterium]|nr:MAG: NAD-dependent epimerase/dehydratase family protein [Ignavibacteriaceae bacterium]MBW7873547.1 NAD-dependent epimerase/dehydratase family protein [Ignavibacteria bacterium]MCZ2143778.1 NAD-dependent epimerase/dehydratase family protein [Ignavibacteriales bacterium]MBV6445951.1 GDP-L-fucose synthase [Ignavibacteriaceae bacterium]MBZ0196205.1 NAD-dependent epimerase/dehydratase family protein [Ignavibacteriaceae bacterium]
MKILITGGAGFIGSHIAEAFHRLGWDVTILDNFTTGKRENLAGLTRTRENPFGKATGGEKSSEIAKSEENLAGLTSKRENPSEKETGGENLSEIATGRGNLSGIAGKVEIIEGDIRDKTAVAKAAAGCDVVVHLAALASVPASFRNPEETYEVNFMGTQNVLEAALQNNVKIVTFASSSAVYGDTDRLPIGEETPANPLSPYGLSKLLSEKLCRFHNTVYGLPVVVFRFFNVYGERQNPFSEYSAVIPKFINIIQNGGTPTIFGDGEQTRDFIYISDLVHAHLLAVEGALKLQPAKSVKPATNTSKSSAAYEATPLNLGSGEKTSLNQLVKIMSQIAGKEIKPQYAPPRSGDILHSFCKIDKIFDEIGFKPQTPMILGIEKMFNSRNFEN